MRPRAIGQVHIPDTVQAVLAARIDLLAPEEKRALQRAAVVGRVFWPGPLRRLLNGDGERVRETLDRLEERELVLSRLGSSVAGEPEFIFKHVLTRDVAYDSLPRRQRGPAHENVAHWIEEAAGTRGREFGELLAYHYVEAYSAHEDGDDRTDELRRRALAALLEVAAEARSRFANAKAIKTAARATELATSPAERIAVLEETGLIALNAYQGDLAWSSLKEAVDLRLEHASRERRAIAKSCARAAEVPLRWPGSMKIAADVAEVRRYLDIGFDHLDDERSEEAIRLLSLRSFEPFGFGWRIPIEDAEIERALDAGLRAADLARAIGRLDLESAALDGAASATLNRGLYGETFVIVERRLALADAIEDPWELADIYAAGAWGYFMVGDYRRAEGLGSTGRDRAGGSEAEGVVEHCLNWAGASLFHLGDWERVLETFAEVEALMGVQASTPPYFMMNLFGAAAFVHEARGLERAHALLDLLNDARGSIHGGSVLASNWLAWSIARRGEHEQAWELIRESHVESMAMRPVQDQMIAELLAQTGGWTQVPAFLEDSRDYAEAAGLRALPIHLTRLEGRAALAGGDTEHALATLARAREGFGVLGATWERARTELDLVDALAAAHRDDEARRMLPAAAPDLERVGAILELERLASIRSRLG